MITYHKSVTDEGGAIGAKMVSGTVNALFSEVLLAEQSAGAVISRKFYIANGGASDVLISNLSKESEAVFAAILFESSGDAQVVGDLTGLETDESPITVTIPAGGHKSFWLQIDVPTGSTKTESFGSVGTKQIL